MSSSAWLSPVQAEVTGLSAAQSQASSTAASQIDALIAQLELAKSNLSLVELQKAHLMLSNANKEVSKDYKSASNALSKASKAVDKKFSAPCGSMFPSKQDPFTSLEAIEALHEAIATHLARTGSFKTLESFRTESGVRFDESILDSLQELHAILTSLERGDCSSALEWLGRQDASKVDPQGDLEFALRQEEYIRTLLGSSPSVSEPLLSNPPLSNVTAALRYGGRYLLPMMTPSRKTTIGALLASPLYMPFSKLVSSPYGWLFTQYAEENGGHNPVVVSKFAEAYLQRVGLPKQSPLEVVTDIGSNGAIAKVQKVQSVMRETKTEWTTVDELPVEIPLPTQHRYHSIFACPVSKEQTTAKNPPMMLPCGHVISRESMLKQAKSAPTLKCTYCPQISHVSSAIKIAFVL